MKRFIPVLAAAALSCLGASPAAAVILDYQLTGDVTASWRIDTSRTADDIRPDMFGYWNVPITVDGVHYDSSVIYFFEASAFGGLEADGGLDQNGAGIDTFFSATPASWDQLYTGSTDHPTLLTGEWDMAEYNDIDFNASPPVWPDNYHLTVTVVPEPAAWLLMIVGFGLIGCALRRSRGRRQSRADGALSAI